MILWLRSLTFNLAFWVTTALVAFFGLPLLWAAPRRWVMVTIHWYARAVLFELRLLCGVTVRIEGGERLPRGGAALIAAKHQSAFDTLVWLILVPDACYILKKELLKLPLWGWWATGSGQIAVDRAAGGAAMRHLIRAGRKAALDGRQLVIFPEGTRTAPHERVPYQPGIAALAAATGLPVLPVATDSGLRWGRNAFLKHPGLITISVLPELPARLDRAMLLAQLEEVIETETARLMATHPVDNAVDNLRAPARP
jgi:1-acyl-sn-glycerol-3-phosphate acyltransferase